MAGQNAAKGAKKGRRFNRPRSADTVRACAARKVERIKAQKHDEGVNKSLREAGMLTPWEQAQAKRAERKAKTGSKAA